MESFAVKKLAVTLFAVLALAACQKPTALATEVGSAIEKGPLPPAAPSGTQLEPPLEAIDPPPSPTIDPNDVKASFPDYKPKDTPDTVTDYRASVSAEIGSLPSAPAALAQAFLDWKAKAAADPGVYEAGAQMLGADERQYKPSDAELVAAVAGERLSAALESADAAARSEADALLATPEARSYNRFDFRHSDVMGSGRYFYASAPRPSRIPG
jgi:hypothetical protein